MLIKPIKKGLITDSYSFPQLFINERVIVFRKSGYAALIKKMREDYGEGFKAVQYHIGFNYGYDAFKNIKEKYGSDIDELLKIGAEYSRIVGFGIIEVVSYSNNRAALRVYNNFECELFIGSNKPQSHFMRGILAGWFAGLWDLDIKKIDVKETNCISMGDPYCEFIITRI